MVIRAKCGVAAGEEVWMWEETGMEVMMVSNAFVSASKSVGERDGLGVESVWGSEGR